MNIGIDVYIDYKHHMNGSMINRDKMRILQNFIKTHAVHIMIGNIV